MPSMLGWGGARRSLALVSLRPSKHISCDSNISPCLRILHILMQALKLLIVSMRATGLFTDGVLLNRIWFAETFKSKLGCPMVHWPRRYLKFAAGGWLGAPANLTHAHQFKFRQRPNAKRGRKHIKNLLTYEYFQWKQHMQQYTKIIP